MEANKCSKCKKFPMVLETGTTMCPRCKISTTSVEAWNTFMKPHNLAELIKKLERPISVLNAVAVLSTDKALIALAATTLRSINELDVSEFILDKKEAEECQNRLQKVRMG